MYEQIDLFISNNSFNDQVDNLLLDIIKEEELLPGSLRFEGNLSYKGANKGMEISKSICSYEAEYPAADNGPVDYTVRKFLKIEQSDNIDLLVRAVDIDKVTVPESALIINKKSDGDFTRIRFNTNDNLIPFIKAIIKHRLKTYKSNASFSCCSQFNKCSDLKKCVHINKLYATGCYYRLNLESNKIFYGKNRNI